MKYLLYIGGLISWAIGMVACGSAFGGGSDIQLILGFVAATNGTVAVVGAALLEQMQKKSSIVHNEDTELCRPQGTMQGPRSERSSGRSMSNEDPTQEIAEVNQRGRGIKRRDPHF